MERKGIHQKQKLLYLLKIFFEETDDDHSLTLVQIIEKLADYGVNADRKTLYEDFAELREFGYDIITEKVGRTFCYHIGSRHFQLPELKLLVDAVHFSKAITEKKSDELIQKLSALASKYEATQIDRQVVITGRIKTRNESIYYNVDAIHGAINADRQIRFKYFRWNVRKEMHLRREGAWYQISPWALVWDDENYYLVGYDAEDRQIKYYRVDKMLSISRTDDRREGRQQFSSYDKPRSYGGVFSMFGGDQRNVTLEAENRMVGAIIDRFGKDIRIDPVSETHFRTIVSVAVSIQFFGWVMALGEGVKITGPDDVVEQMREEAARLARQYA